jgi:hypothetical protein
MDVMRAARDAADGKPDPRFSAMYPKLARMLEEAGKEQDQAKRVSAVALAERLLALAASGEGDEAKTEEAGIAIFTQCAPPETTAKLLDALQKRGRGEGPLARGPTFSTS